MAGKGSSNKKTEDFQEDKVAVANLPFLAALATATKGNGFLYTSDEDREKLPAEFLKTDPSQKNEGGNIATILNQAGLDYAEAHPVAPSVDHEGSNTGTSAGASDTTTDGKPKTKRGKSGFKRPETIEVDDNVPMPASNRSGGASYPFDALKLPDGADYGGSFHIAATQECDDPAKSVASSVTAAIRKYAIPLKNEDGSNVIKPTEIKHQGKVKTKDRQYFRVDRKFVIRVVDDSDPKGAGCRVYRVRPAADETIHLDP